MADISVKSSFNIPSGGKMNLTDPDNWTDEGMVNGALSYHYKADAGSAGDLTIQDKGGEELWSVTGLKKCSRVRLIGPMAHLSGNK